MIMPTPYGDKLKALLQNEKLPKITDCFLILM